MSLDRSICREPRRRGFVYAVRTFDGRLEALEIEDCPRSVPPVRRRMIEVESIDALGALLEEAEREGIEVGRVKRGYDHALLDLGAWGAVAARCVGGLWKPTRPRVLEVVRLG